MGGHEVRHLCGVEARSAANTHETVELPFGGKVRRLLHRCQRGLDPDPVEDLTLDVLGFDLLQDLIRDASPGHAGVRDDHHPPDTKLFQLPSRLIHGPRAERDGGRH
jgi:hypothetical protein